MERGLMTVLYKKDSSDNIRFWKVRTEGAEIVQESGVVGTDSPVEHRKTAKPKNVGKANETTPEEQAVSEMESAITKKKRKGYKDTEEEAKNAIIIKPMLAKKYEDHSKKVKWMGKVPVHVQPKLDGMRCLAIITENDITLMSRGGKEIENLDHIKNALDPISTSIVLDGELYAHGLSFQENMKLIKKYRKGETENVVFHVYDMISKGDYNYRYEMISKIVKSLNHACISLISSYITTSAEDMEEYHQQFLSLGYEGTMIRHSDEGYKVGGRSDKLLKYKDFLDEQYEVVDIIPSDANPEQGIVVCEILDQTFKASYKGTHKEREELLTHKSTYIGEQAEIRFFEKTDGGIPRFPVCVGFRI